MKQKNLFHCSKGRSVVQKIAFTGIFLGLVLLFQFISRFMIFSGTYIKLNLSLLFILPIFYYSGPIQGVLVLILRFIIGPSMSDNGYHEIELTGQFILLICSSITIILMYIFSSIFNKFKNHNLKVILIMVSTLISTSLILTFLNQIFFTPLYFYVISPKDYPNGFSLSKSIESYQDAKMFFFMIPNYWVGTFVTYFAGNLIKYGIIFLCYFPMSKVLRTYSMKQNEIWN